MEIEKIKSPKKAVAGLQIYRQEKLPISIEQSNQQNKHVKSISGNPPKYYTKDEDIIADPLHGYVNPLCGKTQPKALPGFGAAHKKTQS